jgi:uncharacterized protein
VIAVADTGFVLAVVNEGDRHHSACLPLYKTLRTIYLPQSALTEAMYLLIRDAGYRRTIQFLNGLGTTKYKLVEIEIADLKRVAELFAIYADVKLDFVDATVAAVAERMKIMTVLTVDRRDFSIIRPRHAEYFELLPEKL